jgi:hypothetical protein
MHKCLLEAQGHESVHDIQLDQALGVDVLFLYWVQNAKSTERKI